MNDHDMLKAFSGFCFGFVATITILILAVTGLIEVFS